MRAIAPLVLKAHSLSSDSNTFHTITMSQENNFGSGFLLGTLFGGMVGGFVGAIVASRTTREQSESDTSQFDATEEVLTPPSPNDEEMEIARRGLEDKIAQLNLAIDDVRQRLGSSSGNGYSKHPEDVEHDLR